MKRSRTRAQARLRVRRAKLDANIARVQRTIKSLTKKLRRQTGILTKRKARRSKLK